MLTVEDFQNYHREGLASHYGQDHVTDHMVNVDVLSAMGAATEGESLGGLSKALTSNASIAIEGTVGGDALKIQDITQQLANAELNSKDHAPLWNFLKQVPCDSDVVEMTQAENYGRSRGTGYLRTNVASGGLLARDPSLKRKVTPVRWTGHRWQTFTTANALRAINFKNDPVTGGADKVNSYAAMESLILDNNFLGWHGKHSVNEFEPNGIIEQVELAHDGSHYRTVTIIDLEGQAITPETLPKITRVLRAKGAIWTDFWYSNQVQADLEITMESIIRSGTGERITMGIIPESQMVRAFQGQVGRAKFHMDLMLDPQFPDDTFDSEPSSPTKPTTVAAATSADTPENALGGYLAAGVYNYSVCAVGANGRSSTRMATAPVTASGANKVVLTITNGADTTGEQSADFFEVYRGSGTAGTRRYLGRVSAQGIASGATTTYEDKGEYHPGCSTAVAMAVRPHGNGGATWMNRMLHPITQVILPPDVLANQAAYICGWTPQGLTLTHNVVIRNIGPLNGFVGF